MTQQLDMQHAQQIVFGPGGFQFGFVIIRKPQVDLKIDGLANFGDFRGFDCPACGAENLGSTFQIGQDARIGVNAAGVGDKGDTLGKIGAAQRHRHAPSIIIAIDRSSQHIYVRQILLH